MGAMSNNKFQDLGNHSSFFVNNNLGKKGVNMSD